MRQRSDLPEEWGAHIRHEAKRLSQWPVSTRKLISRASSVPIRIRFTLPAPPLDDSRPPDRNSSNFQLIELVLSKAEQETSRRNGVVPGSLVTLAVSGRARIAGAETAARRSLPNKIQSGRWHRILRSLLGMRERASRIVRLSKRSCFRWEASRRDRGLRLSVESELLRRKAAG